MLKLIALGSDGTDSLARGVHLRWAFDSRLGFPENGVRVYRRSNLMVERHCFSTAGAYPGQKVPLSEHDGPLIFYQEGEKVFVPTEFNWHQAIEGGTRIPAMDIMEVSGGISALRVPESAVLLFPEGPVSHVSVTFYVTSSSQFTITPLKGEERYAGKTIDNYPRNTQEWKISAPGITGLEFSGADIFLLSVCYQVCEDHESGSWFELTLGNDLTVPYQLTGDNFSNYYGITDQDYGAALYRLGAKPAERPISQADFAEISQTIGVMRSGDGDTVPVGWSRLAETEGSGDLTTGEPGVDVPATDLLQLSSLQPEMARMLGLYWYDIYAGTYYSYDYKVTAQFPSDHLANLTHQIDFEEFESGLQIPSEWSPGPGVMFKGLNYPSISATPSSLARVEQGFRHNSSNLYLYFNAGVKEVQIFVTFTGSSLRGYAYSSKHPQKVDYKRIYDKEAVLHLHADHIDKVRLYGTGLIVHRIHYDTDQLSDLDLTAFVCGLKAEKSYPLTRPNGLILSDLPMSPSYDSAGNPESSALAGLRWNLPPEPDEILPDGPVAYHVRHLKSGSSWEELTQDKPVYLSASDVENPAPIPGWPTERQLYLHNLAETGRHYYGIRSVDIFGRESLNSYSVSKTFKAQKAPPPALVKAKYLDHSTLDGAGGSTDELLTDTDITLLTTKGTSGLLVQWEWTVEQGKQAPDIQEFRIHTHRGWQNLYQGMVNSYIRTGNLSRFSWGLSEEEIDSFAGLKDLTSAPYIRFRFRLTSGTISTNALAGSWLKIGKESFFILRNTSGSNPLLYVWEPPAEAGGSPELDTHGSITLRPQSTAFVNFKEASGWSDDLATHTEVTAGVGSYSVFIASPAFPSPAFLNPDPEPIRYGQVGVSTINADGIEGIVSTAATVVAVQRTPPPPMSASEIDWGSGMATAANAFGKSTYPIRWKKQGDGLSYFVFRALDQGIFRKDLAERDTRVASDYISVASSLGYTLTSAEADALKTTDYSDLSSTEVHILANMPENAAGFGKIHPKAIREQDPNYQDRAVAVPAIGMPPASGDPLYLLYSDENLEGRGSNTYFYRIQSVGPGGNLSGFSPASTPIGIPQLQPLAAPVISSIKGGEKQVTLSWVKSLSSGLLGYQIYRCTNLALCGDWRRMTHLKTVAGDAYSVSATADPTFTDETAIPRQAYWYGVIAISSDPTGAPLRSPMSRPRTAQAFDLKPPPLPVWDKTESQLVYLDEFGAIYEDEADLPTGDLGEPAIRLCWTIADDTLVYQITKQDLQFPNTLKIMDWEDSFSQSGDTATLLDADIDAESGYRYQIRSRSLAGNTSTGWNTLTIDLSEA